MLRDQAGLFGPVASDPTAWRLLSQLDEAMLAGLRAARAAARAVAWAQHAEVRGDLPQVSVAGRPVEGLVLDIDATIVICHSEKESATRTWKKTFGFHPLLCFLDNTGEALAGLLREGRAGSNTTIDHIAYFPGWISVAHAAALLGLDKQSVFFRIEAGQLTQVYRVQGRTRQERPFYLLNEDEILAQAVADREASGQAYIRDELQAFHRQRNTRMRNWANTVGWSTRPVYPTGPAPVGLLEAYMAAHPQDVHPYEGRTE